MHIHLRRGIISSTRNSIKALGGTVSDVGNYRVHKFLSSGTFQVTGGKGTLEYVIVGGGGSGGGCNGGGGGAGRANWGNTNGGAGGSGIVIISYQI